MVHQEEREVKYIARALRAQACDPKVKVFLSYLYTSDIVNKYLDNALAHENVTRAGFNVLHFLVLNGGSMIPTTISKKTSRSKYSVTRVVDTLEKLGLVERLSTGSDRRTRRIGITRRGLDMVKNGTLVSRQPMCNEIFQTLSEERIAELANLLREVRKNIMALLDLKGPSPGSEED